MAENPNNTIALPGVDFTELAKQAISAHILKGFASSPELITQIVAGALTRKVNSEGKVDSYPHHNTHSFLQFVTEDLIRKATIGVWHASCTCRMGRPDDPMAVTDTAGRVRGVQGLRVVDASLFPIVPCANTNFPTLMTAEKIADAVLAGN